MINHLKPLIAIFCVIGTISCNPGINTEEKIAKNQEKPEPGIYGKLEVDSIQTGMYKQYGYYAPTVIMRWKNKSNEDFTETVNIQVQFIHEGEELSTVLAP